MNTDPAKGNYSWSLMVWLVMVVYAAPLLLAWTMWAPLDTLPYWICLAAGAASALGAWRFSKPPSDARQRQVRLGVICWLPCLAIGVGLGSNRLLDSTPGVAHDAFIVRYDAAQKGPPHLRLSSWREAQSEERLTCTSSRREDICPSLRPGAPVVVTTHEGALGWEWVEKVVPR
jgi:hypothetical protein